MTRMVARAYKLVADALRDAGIKVVMGGPHVTECPDEASRTKTAANATPTQSHSAKPTKLGH